MKENVIKVIGANQHNLKNVNLKFPKNKLVVFTGVSGSGKSSMAFDTIYAEGQRRYVESLSSYARQFLGIMNKPEVESIEGLSPAISIDQKTTSHNPRSTVGTITEIYDYLRLLYARVGHPHCPKCGKEISKQSPQQISEAILELIVAETRKESHARALLLAPIVRDRKGEFTSLFRNLKSQGFQRVRIDGTVFDVDEDLFLIKTNKHTIDVVIDRIAFSKKEAKDDVSISNMRSRISRSVEQALNLSSGLVVIALIKDKGFNLPERPKQFENHLYSEHFACPDDNISLPEIEPRSFSFNSPHGACPTCNGLGTLLKVDSDLMINPRLTIAQGAILPYASLTSERGSWYGRLIHSILEVYNESPDTTWEHLPSGLREILLNGDDSRVFTISGTSNSGKSRSYDTTFEGIINNLSRRYRETQSEIVRAEIEKYMRKEICPECKGARLKKEALSITIEDQNIIDITRKQIYHARKWIRALSTDIFLTDKENIIGGPIIKEINARLDFLVSVGLAYLTLDREASTLAGGEAQRIRLASQIGSGLTGVLYVLDEPTVGLHQRDNQRLITTLKNLRDLGNTVLVVEHDRDTIENADWIVDFGLGAGKYGGELIAEGTLAHIKKSKRSLTGKYLSGKKHVKYERLLDNGSVSSEVTIGSIILEGCTHHNLKNVNVRFPLGKLVCITGVSGSGKSTLIHDILYHALSRELNFLHKDKPGEFKSIKGVGEISKVSLIDQSPIGKTPRSNPATYTKAFDHIRKLFSLTKDAAVSGYQPGRFSFNVRGGRCEACQGGGQVKIEMQFLPDVYVTCEVCNGTRYNNETLEIRYRGKTINDVLKMNVDEAVEFFGQISGLGIKLKMLKEVGLGYIELGQPAPTLSGGEAQRIKISRELSVTSPGHTVYLLDEPTTGLHFADLEKLLSVLKQLVFHGNTVIVIEHNLDIIKNADHIIDLGPEGGDEGGKLIAEGTPKQVAKIKSSHTGNFLSRVL